LTVSGTTTYINTTTLNVGDNILTLNADIGASTAPTENAGIEVKRGNAATRQFYWNETTDRWYSDTDFEANGNLYGTQINTGQGLTEVHLMNQNVRTTDAVTFATVNTGQGANELYAMNQNVRTSDSPSFTDLTLTGGNLSITNNNGGIDFNDASGYWLRTATNWGLYWDTSTNILAFHGAGTERGYVDLDNGNFQMDGTGTFGGALSAITLDTGQGANELYAMNQNVRTTDSVTFANITSTGNFSVGNKSIKSYDVSVGTGTTVKWSLVRNDGTAITSTSSNYVYRVQLITLGTGTNTGAVFLAQNVDGAGWVVRTVTREGIGSNYPYLFVDTDGIPKVTSAHPSNYITRIIVEEINGGVNGATYGLFGADSLIAFDGAGTTSISGTTVSMAQINTGQGATEVHLMNQNIRTTDSPTFNALTVATLNTGQGANELYAMNQNVRTTDAVTFATVDTGQGATEVHLMNQNVRTTDTVTHTSITANNGFSAAGLFNNAFLQVTDTNNFWITPGNNTWGLYFETTAGGLLGGSGDSNRLGFVGNSNARFWVDLNNGNGWFGGTLTATQIDTGQGLTEVHLMNQNVRTTDAVTFATINTGQGATEVHLMNQNLRTTDSPTFNALTVATLNTGQGANELYAMNQNVRTTDSPTFNALSLSNTLAIDNHYYKRLTLPSPSANAGAGRWFVQLYATSVGAVFAGGRLRVGGTWNWASIMGVLEVEFGVYTASGATSISSGQSRISAATGAAKDSLRIGGLEVVGGYVGFYIWSANTNSPYVLFDGYCTTAPTFTSTAWASNTLPAFTPMSTFGGFNTDGPLTATTIDTGQGATEVHLMNQNVRTTDSPTFNALTVATINSGQGTTEVHLMNQNVRTTDAVTFATINTGQGATEVHLMNQNVRTTDAVTFAGITGTAYFDAQSSSGFRLRNAAGTANVGGFTRRGLWEGNANYDPALWAETGYGLYFYTNGDGVTAKGILDTGGTLTLTGNLVASQVNTGQGLTEVHLMNQNVRTTDSPTFANLYVDDAIYHTGDTDTYMQFNAANAWRVVTGGGERIAANSNGLLVTGQISTGIGYTELYLMNQNVRTTDAVTFATVDTGQGATEVHLMNQNLRTTDSPTFNALTVATLNTGQGANELYAMNQNVRTTDSPTFAGLTVGGFRVATGGNIQAFNGSIDNGSFYNITDEMTSEEVRRQLGTTNANVIKVDDNTAPAEGCFQVTNYVSVQHPKLIKVDVNSQYTFEVWIKVINGGSNEQRLYMGWSMYDLNKSYFGNTGRYWGSGGEQFDLNSRNDGQWYKVTGKIGGTGGAGFVSGTQYAAPLFLFNYSASTGTVTRYCGLKLYKSEQTIGRLHLHTGGGYVHGTTDQRFPYLEGNNNNILRLQTSSGNLLLGPANTSYAHIETDRPAFYFNKQIEVDTGVIRSYDDDLNLNRAGSTSARIRITNGETYLDQATTVATSVTAPIYYDTDTAWYVNPASTSRLNEITLGTDQFVSRRYVKSVGGINNAGYTNICNITGGGLGSAVKMSFVGTTGSVVVATTAEIIVNHFQDIYVKSESGIYTQLTIRVISNNNENFSVQVSTNSANPVTLDIEVFPLNGETVVFTTTANQSANTLTHVCYPGMAISATGGNSGNLRIAGDLTAAQVDTGQGLTEVHLMNQNLRTTDSPTFNVLTVGTINSGQGATEVHLMNQNVRTTDAVTFTTINTGQGATEVHLMNQNVRTTDSPTFNALTVATLNTGQGANELYAMNQNVRTTDNVTFANVTSNLTGTADRAEAVDSNDTRNTNNTPSSRPSGIYFDFKANSTNGLSDGGTYNGQMTWRSYGSSTDLSGGQPIQIAYTESGRLWSRLGTSTTAWASWRQILNSVDQAFAYNMNQNVRTTDSPTFATINTGQGATEVHLMNQNVRTTDSVTFANVTGNNFTLPQNPVGTTYGNGVSTVPPRMISQTVGDNDGWRLYGEAGATNQVRMVFELVDDIETAYSDQWTFRNKLTYGAYTARNEFYISGDGDAYARTSMRAPIFYDIDSPAYYADFASTSNLNTVQAITYRFGSDTNKGYAQAYSTFGSTLRKISYISMNSGASNWDDYSLHGISSTNDAGTFTDSISINSYNDINLRLDTNNNNTNSYLRIHDNTTGNAMNVAYIGRESNNAIAYFYNRVYGAIFYDHDSSYYGDFNSTSRVNRINADYLYSYNWVYAQGDVIAYYSDERLKTKVGSIENALDKISKLNGFYYVENDLAKSFGYKNEKRQLGLSAQEVKEVLPEIVTLAAFDIDTDDKGNTIGSKSGEDYLTVNYGKVVPLLVEGIKEQTEIIKSQQKQIDELKEMIKSLIK
jgi:hypothetical protein